MTSRRGADRATVVRCKRAAHLWLFNAGVAPDDLDVKGETLARSLAGLLFSCVRHGRDLERDDEVTGEYEVGKLEELRSESKGEVER